MIEGLYNYYNLAIYNVESDTVSYHYKSNWTKSPGNEDFPLLVKLSNDILLFSSDPNTITILKYSKAEILGFISDKQNKRKCELCKSIKIYGEDRLVKESDGHIPGNMQDSASVRQRGEDGRVPDGFCSCTRTRRKEG